jgi:D-threo-aldose 1-dehydrogenase
VIQKLTQLRAVAERHGVDLRSAALQFSSAASEAVSLIVGAGSAREIQEDWNSMQTKIPQEFWSELKHQGLIEENASTPAL